MLITKDEIVEGDVLILDASERFFDINSQRLDGKSALQAKEALRVTFGSVSALLIRGS